MANYDILLLACKHNDWAVNVFVNQFERYFPSAAVSIVSEDNYLTISDKHRFTKLPNELLINGECPVTKFSDSLMFALSIQPSKHVMVMLADYWLYGDVDAARLDSLAGLMAGDDSILRVNIGDDQRTTNNCVDQDLGLYECADSEKACFLATSLCPAIWNKDRYLQMLEKGWTPWITELRCEDKFLGRPTRGRPTRGRPTRGRRLAKNDGNFTHLRSLWCYPKAISYHNSLRSRDNNTMVARRETIDEYRHLIPPRFTITFEN